MVIIFDKKYIDNKLLIKIILIQKLKCNHSERFIELNK